MKLPDTDASMTTRNWKVTGFTLIEIMIVVAIIGLLAAIAVPNYVRARQLAQTNSCINNLRQVDSAKQQWALENGKTAGDTPAWLGVAASAIEPYVGRGGAGSIRNVFCPIDPQKTAQTSYTMGAIGVAPTCVRRSAPLHNAVIH